MEALAKRKVFGKPDTLTGVPYHYCPGCGHSLIHRLVCEIIDEMGKAGETVAIFGDFDVDGVTATTVLVEGLRRLGARPLSYIPHRFTEGYGPNVQAVRGLHERGRSADGAQRAPAEAHAAQQHAQDHPRGGGEQ